MTQTIPYTNFQRSRLWLTYDFFRDGIGNLSALFKRYVYPIKKDSTIQDIFLCPYDITYEKIRKYRTVGDGSLLFLQDKFFSDNPQLLDLDLSFAVKPCKSIAQTTKCQKIAIPIVMQSYWRNRLIHWLNRLIHFLPFLEALINYFTTDHIVCFFVDKGNKTIGFYDSKGKGIANYTYHKDRMDRSIDDAVQQIAENYFPGISVEIVENQKKVQYNNIDCGLYVCNEILRQRNINASVPISFEETSTSLTPRQDFLAQILAQQ